MQVALNAARASNLTSHELIAEGSIGLEAGRQTAAKTARTIDFLNISLEGMANFVQLSF
jgi:hypothetical protein